ncbi:LysR family transcriptional regulator [Gallaecimonas kandeliae]|uniref:LysR family transcriptional regulator n=1 Tax=Gallaecimonas kandeliae TaxID=3029055 RepID=UPI002649A85D|nr:LysR family transcriptional regulator [Gallaecimonas kandeliae]WKE65769.1 LysR family transcriptional regulator [Gallaecimonas kandeliae]
MGLIERLSDMAVYAKVVELGSFSQAAGSLGLSKGAVSKAVSRLEDHLDLQLLHRSTRQLRLTTEGQAFYDYCTQVVDSAQAAEEHLGELRSEPQGLVRISAPFTLGSLQVAPLLPGLLERHPCLQLDLAMNDSQVDLVQERIDIAVRCGPLANSSLIARPVKPLAICLVATPGYFERHGKPNHPQELAASAGQHQCLTYSSHPGSLLWRFYQQQQLLEVRVKSLVAVNNNLALRHSLLAGLGMAYMPRYSLEKELETGVLETALEAFMPPPQPMHLVYPERKHLSSAVRATLDYLQETLGEAHY